MIPYLFHDVIFITSREIVDKKKHSLSPGDQRNSRDFQRMDVMDVDNPD